MQAYVKLKPITATNAFRSRWNPYTFAKTAAHPHRVEQSLTSTKWQTFIWVVGCSRWFCTSPLSRLREIHFYKLQSQILVFDVFYVRYSLSLHVHKQTKS